MVWTQEIIILRSADLLIPNIRVCLDHELILWGYSLSIQGKAEFSRVHSSGI